MQTNMRETILIDEIWFDRTVCDNTLFDKIWFDGILFDTLRQCLDKKNLLS